jgi:hypothetical protein
MFRLVQREWEETGMHVRDLWARHLAVAGGSVCRVQAVSSRAAPVSPRLAARPRGALLLLHVLLQCPARKRPLSRLGKGLDLRKLVAGAGFEPATSGL